MNGRRDFGRPLTDAQFREVQNEFYNVWYRRWKDAKTQEQYDAAVSELVQLLRKYRFWEFPTVAHLALTMLYAFDGKFFGGFTETTSRKLLSLLEAEAGVK